jgi:hypothetical protein
MISCSYFSVKYEAAQDSAGRQEECKMIGLVQELT